MRNSYIFIQENAFENVVSEMAVVLAPPQCVKWSIITTATAQNEDMSIHANVIMNVMMTSLHETFSVWLALYERNPPMVSSHRGALMWTLMFYLFLVGTMCLSNKPSCHWFEAPEVTSLWQVMVTSQWQVMINEENDVLFDLMHKPHPACWTQILGSRNQLNEIR